MAFALWVICSARIALADAPKAEPKQSLTEALATLKLEPLETSTAALPADGSETVNVVTGDKGEYLFAHASGYVKAPIADVWKALRTPEALIDRRRVDTYRIEPSDDSDVADFRVHNTVHGMAVVEFDVTWKYGVLDGKPAKLKTVLARGRKTGGSTLVKSLEDSITLRTVDAKTTSVELVRHLKASSTSVKDAEKTLRDFYANIVAVAHGGEPPKYR